MACFRFLVFFSAAFLVHDITAMADCNNDKWFRILDKFVNCHNCNKHQNPRTNTAFFVQVSSTSKSFSQTVIWNRVVTNVGNGYNPSNGIFTAPESGLYNFQWSILAYHKTNAYTELVVDGKNIVRNHAEAHGVNLARSNTTSAIIKLKRGQKVWIRKYSGHLKIWGDLWSSFQGYKM